MNTIPSTAQLVKTETRKHVAGIEVTVFIYVTLCRRIKLLKRTYFPSGNYLTADPVEGKDTILNSQVEDLLAFP